MLSLRLLGPVAVALDGRDIQGLPRRSQALLAYLGTAQGRSLSRDRAADLIWPDCSNEVGRHRLRSSLLALRHALGPSPSDILVTSPVELRIKGDAVSVDVVAFDTLLTSKRAEDMARAAELYAGEFLAELGPISETFDEWARAKRVRISEAASALLTQLCDLQSQGGDHSGAIATGLRLIEIDRLSEEAYRALIGACLRAGRFAQARRHYLACADMLRSEFQLDVSPDMADLLAEIERVERTRPERGRPTPSVVLEASPLAAKRATIEVTAFESLSADPEQGYFAAGITQDIATALSRFRSLAVIAAQPIAARPGAPPEKAGHGARYVLDGSVRRIGNRVRVVAKLVEAESNAQIWGDKLDREITDLFDLQDDITERIVGAIEPEILRAEIESVQSRPYGVAAYETALKGYEQMFVLTPEANAQALGFLRQAIQREPSYARAYAFASWGNLFRIHLHQGGSIRPIVAEALAFAERAVELDPGDALIQSIRAAWQLMIERDYEGAVRRAERAFEVNPNSVWVCGNTGFGHALSHNPDRALELIARARRLSPNDPSLFIWLSGGALAHLTADRPSEAIAWTCEALRQNPRHLFSLLIQISALVRSGDREEARRLSLNARRLNPRIDLKLARNLFPLKLQAERARLLDDLERAGIAA